MPHYDSSRSGCSFCYLGSAKSRCGIPRRHTAIESGLLRGGIGEMLCKARVLQAGNRDFKRLAGEDLSRHRVFARPFSPYARPLEECLSSLRNRAPRLHHIHGFHEQGQLLVHLLQAVDLEKCYEVEQKKGSKVDTVAFPVEGACDDFIGADEVERNTPDDRCSAKAEAADHCEEGKEVITPHLWHG